MAHTSPAPNAPSGVFAFVTANGSSIKAAANAAVKIINAFFFVLSMKLSPFFFPL
jgi:hypothetical protein